MSVRLSNETEYGSQGPSKYAALFCLSVPRQLRSSDWIWLGGFRDRAEEHRDPPRRLARHIRTSARRELPSFQREDLCATQF
jgi:hypothetical protein